MACPKCGSNNIEETCVIGGVRLPVCKKRCLNCGYEWQ